MTAHLDPEAMIARLREDKEFAEELPVALHEPIFALLRGLPTVLASHLDAPLTNETYLAAKIAMLRLAIADEGYLSALAACTAAAEGVGEERAANFLVLLRAAYEEEIELLSELLASPEDRDHMNLLGATMLEIAMRPALAHVTDAYNDGTLTVAAFVQAVPAAMFTPEF